MAAQGEDVKGWTRIIKNGPEENCGDNSQIPVLIMMFPQVYTYVKTYNIVHFKYVLFIVFKMYFIKAV